MTQRELKLFTKHSQQALLQFSWNSVGLVVTQTHTLLFALLIAIKTDDLVIYLSA